MKQEVRKHVENSQCQAKRRQDKDKPNDPAIKWEKRQQYKINPFKSKKINQKEAG